MRRLALAAAILAIGCERPATAPTPGTPLFFRSASSSPSPGDARAWARTPPAMRNVVRDGERFTFLAAPEDAPGCFLVRRESGDHAGDDMILPADCFRRSQP